MATRWEKILQRWAGAGLVDAATAERIRAYESEQDRQGGLRWPVLLALAFGGLLLGAGVLLFVAAHWDDLSPGERFSLVLLMVAVFHVGGALVAEKFSVLATVLHAVGTITLGAGIFLAGQIFNLEEHWPGGVMLWAAGAWIGWGIRRDWVQATLVALLTPGWLAGEWQVATERYRGGDTVLAQGMLLLTVTYLTAQDEQHDSHVRHALKWIGGLCLIPFVFWVLESRIFYFSGRESSVPVPLVIFGWAAGLGLPLLLAMWLRGRAARWNFVAALWVVVLGATGRDFSGSDASFLRYVWHELGPYFWCALGAVALIAWGLKEGRRERINLGVAGFALTILFFYFSSVMDKLGRASSLIGLGVIFLVGGWVLEKTRRRLVARLKVSAT